MTQTGHFLAAPVFSRATAPDNFRGGGFLRGRDSGDDASDLLWPFADGPFGVHSCR